MRMCKITALTPVESEEQPMSDIKSWSSFSPIYGIKPGPYLEIHHTISKKPPIMELKIIF